MEKFAYVAQGVPAVRKHFSNFFKKAADPAPRATWNDAFATGYADVLASWQEGVELKGRGLVPGHCGRFSIFGAIVEVTLEITPAPTNERGRQVFEAIGKVSFYRYRERVAFFTLWIDPPGNLATRLRGDEPSWELTVDNPHDAVKVMLSLFTTFLELPAAQAIELG